MISNIPKAVLSNAKSSYIIEPPPKKITLTKNSKAVEKINDNTIGLTPDKAPWTNLFFRNLFIIIATIKMMIKEGKTTPKVAHKDPRMPAVLLPTNVAILIAKGPGVASLIAMKSVSSVKVIHPLPKTCS